MKREDLFAAIGEVEESRLARSEMTVQPSVVRKTEGTDMNNRKRSTSRMARNLLIAAVLVSMLALTAFASVGYFLYDSPAQLLAHIFGNETGYDRSDGAILRDPAGGPEGILVEPTFERVPADDQVVQEDVAPFVSPVGQSISWEGYTLTVDAFMYDSTTKCGFFTYFLENPNGVSGYRLQTTGEIWYDGRPDIVEVNQYGYSYIIQEKTTDTCLAATYFFRIEERDGSDLRIWFSEDEPDAEFTVEQVDEILLELEKALREELTPEDAIREAIDMMGEATFAANTSQLPEDAAIDPDTYPADYAYTVLTHQRYRQQYKEGNAKLLVDCAAVSALPNVTAENGSVVITPISLQIDVTDIDYLHEMRDGEWYIHADNVDAVVIRYRDGSEFVVDKDYHKNYTFAVCTSASNGETDNHNLVTYAFNRIIDVDAVAAIVINGREVPVN